MEIIFDPIFLQHTQSGHPENRRRLEGFEALPEKIVENGSDYLGLVHHQNYIERVKRACKHQRWLDPDTPAYSESFEVACRAVGATLEASERNGFALIRPPGHHAYFNHASGFCLFNNIAIATQRLVQEGKRVAIFDFDGHLGDGTSDFFYRTDQVLYWSTHQFPAFPGKGWYTEIGDEKGKGFTINVPLPPMSGDDIFMDSVRSILPLVEQFQPDVLAVSAGFDAHLYDPLLQLRLSSTSFFNVGVLLKSAFPNMFAALEGGYNIEELPRCVYNFIAGVEGKEIPSPEAETESSREVWETYELNLHSLLGLLSEYYKV